MKKRNGNRVYHYTIDKEGRLWIEGTELTDPQVLKFFMRQMEKLPGGKFQVKCMGETNLIQAEDVPYVVQDIRIQGGEVELIFPGGYRETLDPHSLRVGKDNVLNCRIRNGEFAARFNRKPYLELSRYVERDQGKNYYLNLAGRRFHISGVQEPSP